VLLIVGLGNPGRRYENHRHNVGFMAADAIARRHRFGPWRARFEGEIAEGTLSGEKALVLKPATYMNESGRSVGQAARFYKLQPSDVVVIHDELDLPPGKVRLKAGGGNGGHNGLKSLDAHLGRDTRRLRIGIGHPGAKDLVHGYVLHDFSRSDEDWLRPLLDAIAENAPLLAKGEDASFMNKLHLATARDGAGESAPDKAAPRSAPSLPSPERGTGGVLAESLRRLLGREG
jgi:peptidyl-tRNA hydrolase, PTH1 family